MTDSLAIRVATVPVSVPFSVQSKICTKFLVPRFLTVINNPKFCYVIGQIPGKCDNCFILCYLIIPTSFGIQIHKAKKLKES